MMTGTPEKLKFKKLKARLKLSFWEAVGLLESLWLITYANAPCGDIGRLTDEEIAVALEWEGEPQKLIEALVDSHWLDRYPCACHRLIVHDWHEHCSNSHKGNFAKYRKRFAMQSPCDALRSVLGASLESNQTKPNPTNQPTNEDACGGLVGWLEPWKEVADRLTQMKAARWRDAIDKLHEQGCDPTHALAVIDYGVRNKYGIGAIISRLKFARPTLAISANWPKGTTPEVAAACQADSQRKLQDEAAAFEIIRAGRKAGKSDEQIHTDLAAKNLRWPE